jgi:hypothetical protein
MLGPLLALVQTGCGGPAEVKGHVTLDGKPVSGATVLFVPEPGSSARPASGLTDGEGNFRLTTYRPNDGAVPGTYKIVVTKSEGVPSPPDPDHASKKRALDYERRIAGRDRPKRIIPAIYGDAETTTLRCTVPASGTVNVELSSTAKRQGA